MFYNKDLFYFLLSSYVSHALSNPWQSHSDCSKNCSSNSTENETEKEREDSRGRTVANYVRSRFALSRVCSLQREVMGERATESFVLKKCNSCLEKGHFLRNKSFSIEKAHFQFMISSVVSIVRGVLTCFLNYTVYEECLFQIFRFINCFCLSLFAYPEKHKNV